MCRMGLYRHFLTIFHVCPIFFIDFSGTVFIRFDVFYWYWDIHTPHLAFEHFWSLFTAHEFCYKQAETPNNIDKRPKSKADLIATVNARCSEIGTDRYYLFYRNEKIRDFINLILAFCSDLKKNTGSNEGKRRERKIVKISTEELKPTTVI